MKKPFLLAAVALSLLLLGHGILWPGSSAAMPMPQDTPVATETPSPMPQDTPVATETPAPVPTLILDKGVTDLDGEGKVVPGDTIKYTISFSNTGQITATNVILVDDYDETLIESVANITGGGMDDGSTITWELGALADGEGDLISYEATLKGTLPPGTTALANEATISSSEVEPIRVAKAVQVQRPELTIAKAREEIDLDDDGVIDAGDAIKYKITYENKGDAAAANAVVVDDYPETLVASIDNISSDGEDDGSAITWELGIVKAGVKASLTYEVKLKSKFPPGTTSVDNTAEIKSDETYPMRAEQSVPIKVPNLTIAKEKAPGLIKDLNGNGIADPGDTIKYDIAYENKGDADATEVIIVDDYPETLIASITNISGDGKDDGSIITWDLGILAAGESGSLSYEATLKETFPLGPTNVQNPATISSKETEPTSATATVKVEVAPTPTPEPTPKPEKPEEEGPAAGIFAGMPLLPGVLIGILAIVAMVVLAYVGAIAKYSPDKEAKDDLNRQRIALVREGVFLIFIVSAVLILAIGRGIEPDGAISILSAIVGYVFARAARPT